MALTSLGAVAAQAQGPVRLHADHVLGTSMDLLVAADEAAAEAFFAAARGEVERLEGVFSTWREGTQADLLNRGKTVQDASPALLELLRDAEELRLFTRGAFDVRLGAVAELWANAARTGKPPADAAVAAAVAAAAGSGWSLDFDRRSIAPKGELRLALDGIAKGRILDLALGEARRVCPQVGGGLLDIGGDQRAFGKAADGGPFWLGIADPRSPQDNAPPLLRVPLRDRAAATSGGQARSYEIGGVRHSRILDPGFGRPATGVLQATALADDAATADAVATALFVLPPAEGLQVARSMRGVDCLILAADGRRHLTPGFAALLEEAVEEPSPAVGFADGMSLSITLQLPKLEARRYERPYAAVWIEDDQGRHVVTLALWGRNRRWASELTNWWRKDGDAADQVDAIGRASRGPGEYRLVWNGADKVRKPAPPGDYTVVIEVSREHGGHTTARQQIACRQGAAEAQFVPNRELAGAQLRYEKRQEGQ